MKKLLLAVCLLPVLYTQAQIGIGTTSPNSTLDVRGAFSTAVTTFTTNTTAGSSDNLLVFTGTSAATLTLPTAAGITGREYWIKNASSNSSTLTIATTAAQTVDGLSSWSLIQTNKVIRLVSNGSNWYAASESLPGTGSGTGWLLGGNSVGSLQKIGTTSNYDLPFITNNTEKMRLTTSGSLGIGSSTFNGTYPERLLVDAGSTGNTNFQNVIVGKGNTNSYAQLNIQNINAGTGASSDVVATADNGSETTNYVDMGINGSGNTSNVMGVANDAYLYNVGQNFFIGTGTAAKSLIFLTGGTDSATNQRMRIDGNGNVGIGTASPVTALHVVKSNSGGNVLTLQNTSVSGYSSADFLSNTGVLSGTFGYGNGSTGAPFTGRNYFNSYGNDFLLANGSFTPFLVQGSTNNVGVNNTNPSEKLDVTGNIRFSGALMPNNTAGTAGYFLQSNGAGTSPTWIDPSSYLSSLSWMQGGNTLSAIKKLGTISNHDLPIITNNTEKMRITAAGTVGIGTSTFSGTNPEELIVDAGSTGNTNFQNVIVGKGNTNSYAQLNIQNNSAGTASSSDVVATANNGTESVNYIDMGINGGGNTSTGLLGAANTAYLYATGNDFAIGNATSAKDVILFTGGTATTNERLRATANGVTTTGSLTVSYRSGTGNYTLLSTDHVIINTGAAATWTLPAASGCAGRIYRLLNQGTGNITLSVAVTTANGTTSTTLVNTAGTNFYEILSDGTVWRRIN